MTCMGISGKTYQLGEKIQDGGEGTVYHIQKDQNLVAKIYHNTTSPDKMQRLEKKLRVMVRDSSFDAWQDGTLRFAWPQDVLYENGKFCGFIMPFAKDTFAFHEILWDSGRDKFKHYDYNRSIAIAYNLTQAVDYVHTHGYVIGDMNIKNFRFSRDCRVIVLDVDSFDITDPATGEHYKCSVGHPEMLAPELQGMRLDTERAKFTKETDYFSLAILIFRILMNGAHPFNAPKIESADDYDSSSSDNGTMTDIAKGKCPYVSTDTGRKVPIYAPDFAMLPASLQTLFCRTFRYTEATARKSAAGRASTMEFAVALYRFYQRDKVTCSADSRHKYLSRVGRCPFCEVKAKQNSVSQASINRAAAPHRSSLLDQLKFKFL